MIGTGDGLYRVAVIVLLAVIAWFLRSGINRVVADLEELKRWRGKISGDVGVITAKLDHLPTHEDVLNRIESARVGLRTEVAASIASLHTEIDRARRSAS